MATAAFVFDAYGTLYDVQSVAAATERAFPGRGELVTQVWRQKQLEYTWLRTVMGDHADFGTVTAEALRFTTAALELEASPATLRALLRAYDQLAPYPEARAALQSLAGRRRAILSNGSRAMLEALVAHSGFGELLDAVLSVDEIGLYKPAQPVYRLVTERFGVAPSEIVFVSSNPFDVAGAKRFGMRVAWIERVTTGAIQAELAVGGPAAATTMFKMLRGRPEAFGAAADWRIGSLAGLADLPVD